MHYNFTQKIIRYSQSTINALTGSMWEEGVRIYGTPKIHNNFPFYTFSTYE